VMLKSAMRAAWGKGAEVKRRKGAEVKRGRGEKEKRGSREAQFAVGEAADQGTPAWALVGGGLGHGLGFAGEFIERGPLGGAEFEGFAFHIWFSKKPPQP